jgi:geranylgeranyl pyrophosphate synthase
MVDEEDDVGEELEAFQEFLSEVEEETTTVEAALNEVMSKLGNTPVEVAVKATIGAIKESLMPALTGLGDRALAAIAEVAAGVDGPDGSMLETEDAVKLTAALLGAAQLIAVMEAEATTDERHQQCEHVGKQLSEALKLIKDITVIDEPEDEDTGEDTDKG